jgi:hypothetical protein
MSDLDRRLEAALSVDDQAFLDSLENERGLFAQIAETYRGPLRYMTAAASIGGFAATAVGLWSIWEMFAADSTRGLILWAAAGWAAWTVQIALKQWIFDRMNLKSILRELKRIELRLVLLERQRPAGQG